MSNASKTGQSSSSCSGCGKCAAGRGNTKRKRIVLTAVGLAAVAEYFLIARTRQLHWGATKRENRAYLPGDELLADAENASTHAITIDAPPADVWPWLAQIGQDKGGFYSFAMLENLVGCDIHNAHEIHPEWQSVKEGDKIHFHPDFPPQPVSLLEKCKHLVIGANLKTENASTWAFVLRDLGNGKTRFVVRLRWRSHKGLGRVGDILLLEHAHFVMERKMMTTIKELAEERANRTEVS